ncbi:Urease [Savitreella phatthalungensis]
MNLSPREIDKLLIVQVGQLAQRRLARGVQLNEAEARGLIAYQLHELIRDGHHTVSQLMSEGKQLLGRRQVQAPVIAAMHEVMVEGTFPDGTYLVTVHQPISSEHGNLEKALAGSFLPVPDPEIFPAHSEASLRPENQPGAVLVKPGKILLNAGRQRTELRITNTGDRPIQVGSHYHLIETNPALQFDRARSYGLRLDIAAGTAVRFEPGDTRTVRCVPIVGNRIIQGGSGVASGVVDPERLPEIMRKLQDGGFKHAEQLA